MIVRSLQLIRRLSASIGADPGGARGAAATPIKLLGGREYVFAPPKIANLSNLSHGIFVLGSLTCTRKLACTRRPT